MIAILQSAPAFGAIERYVLDIVEGLRGGSEEVALVYPDVAALAAFADAARDNVRAVPLPPGLVGGPAPRLALALTRVLRGLRPRLVHVNDPWPAAQLAARLAGVRRLLVTHHTPELPRSDNVAGRAWQQLGWLLRPEVVYTSESDRSTDARRSLKTHVVYYGIELDRFTSARPVLPPNGPLIGNVARMVPQKGQRLLIDAAPLVLARHPGARFMIVGEGELREELEQHARAAGVADHVVLSGPREDIPELMASFDVFALPSYFEGLCYVVIEAQAAGVPVVATPVGGVRENVVPGETGVLCVPGDAVSLADGINALLERPDETRRLVEEARRRVLERYSQSRMVSEMLALYAV